MVGSYKPEQMRDGLAGEAKRLIAQVQLTFEQELAILKANGVRDGDLIMEVGIGTGAFLSRLIDAFPNATFVGIEPNIEMLDVARNTLSQYSNEPRLIHSDIQGLQGLQGLQNAIIEGPHNAGIEPVDHIIARMVFQHLQDSVGAAETLMTFLKPGGTLTIIDVDGALWGMVEPSITELVGIHFKAWASQGAHGGDRFIGHKLTRILRDAGFEHITLQVAAVDNVTTTMDNFVPLIHPENLLPQIEEGVVTLPEYKRAVKGYYDFINNPDTTILTLNFIACGLKPL